MSDTKQRLTTSLLRLGQSRLGEIWDVDASEVGRRLNGQRNISLDDICLAIDELGIRLITPDQNMESIDRQELQALRVLAHLALEHKLRETDYDPDINGERRSK